MFDDQISKLDSIISNIEKFEGIRNRSYLYTTLYVLQSCMHIYPLYISGMQHPQDPCPTRKPAACHKQRGLDAVAPVHLGEAPGARLDLADAVLQRIDQLLACDQLHADVVAKLRAGTRWRGRHRQPRGLRETLH